jgi:hypothetical protein
MEEPEAGEEELNFASASATAGCGLSNVSAVSRQVLKTNLIFFITPLN